jgi:hypothetical protein
MNLINLFKAAALIATWINSLILHLKKEKIKEEKENALNSGDQRNFETSFNSDDSGSSNSSVSGKYDRMYERTRKNKD